jgi:hypothetical protein
MPGAEEAVRLKALGRPVLAGGGRFCEQAFRLTQVIEVTRFLPSGEDGERRIYAVLTTRSELFRSSPWRTAASTGPARVYEGEPCELTLIAATGGVPEVQTLPNPDGHGVPVIVAQPFLLFLEKNQKPEAVPEKRRLEITAPSSEDWEPIGAPSSGVFLRKFTVPDDMSTDFEILIMMFRRPQPLPPPTETLPVLQPDYNDAWACLKVNRLKSQARFRAPKMSLALLARAKESDLSNGPYRLSGYGRLGDSEFTPIRPGPGLTPGEVEWSRIAGFRALDRADERHSKDNADEPFDYDVIVYGPGGELIPTIQPSQ